MIGELLLVNEQDQLQGYGEKTQVHRQGQLHRAFSVFFYDEATDSVLIQKRAQGKYHSGGLFSNTCCSHPYKGETFRDAIVRCIEDELGFRPEFEAAEAGKFHYFSDYGEMKEHEIDHVWVLKVTAGFEQMKPNPDEVASLSWMQLGRLDAMTEDERAEFTSWFWQAYGVARTYIRGRAVIQDKEA